MKPHAVARAERLLDGEAVEWTPVANRIGSTNQERWRLRLADGRAAFVKQATHEASAEWIRAEHAVYDAVEASFMPRLLSFESGDSPLLVLEDLGDAHWPPPWTQAAVEAAKRALDELAAVAAPAALPRLADERGLLAGWGAVAADPAPFLALGLCAPGWLERALPELAAAAAAADLAGDRLVHVDIRSDNLCCRAGRAVLVDWNQAAAGNPLADRVLFAPSLAMEGGPPPEELVPPGAAPGLVAAFAGFLAARAGLPAPDWGPALRGLQLGQLRVALPWAARELGLPAPA